MTPLTRFRNVWLCDDDDDDHYVFAEALKQALPDGTLSVCTNGSELLRRLERETPDILFLDINMPLVNGIEALISIRQRHSLKELPIVMYSVSEQPGDVAAACTNGAVLYLVKPQLYQDLVFQLKGIFALDWSQAGRPSSLRFDGQRFVRV